MHLRRNKDEKTIGLVLAGAMVLSLAACGQGNGGSAQDDGTTFRIGGIGPLTGNNAIYGNAVMNGAQMAVDEINADGGINGVQLEFDFQDDESDAERAVNAYNQLKDWGMDMLVGTTTSSPCEAVVARSNEDNMFQITPSATSVNSIQYENAFRMCFSDPSQGTASADYIAENGLASKIGIIYDSSDTYSSGIASAFESEAQAKGLEIVSKEAFTGESNTDFSVQLQKAKDAGAELLFLPIYYTQTALILAQADTIGFEPLIFGSDGFDGILDVDNFDKSLAEGVMFLTPFSTNSTDELTQNFVQKYEEQFGGTPNQFAADAYDSVYVIKQAAEQAGLTADMSASEMCDALKTAMTEISFTGLTGKDIQWGADGEPQKAPIVVQVENGEYQILQ
ncbi:MAG TPA: ABC transporter substrate-binding protein [Candidatus Scybalocola faecipullorum]|nr:ABC transporter substrate-binding protein [Candidatus Scybalocola faecipullorum]